MKKNIKRTIIALTLFTFATPIVSAQSYGIPVKHNEPIIMEDIISEDKVQNEMKEYMEKTYGKDYKKFLAKNDSAANKAEKIKQLFTSEKTVEVSYPKFFGGLYINDENDLVLQVVDTNITYDEQILYNKITKDYKNLKIEIVKNSYSELKNIYDYIVDTLQNKFEDNITTAVYIDDMKNKIIVELKDYSQESIDLFQDTIIESEFIEFRQGVKSIDLANLNPGGQWLGNTNNICSWGYRAKKGLAPGMVSAGHCTTPNFEISGVGKVEEYQFSGNFDALWVSTTNNATPTNTLSSGGTLNTKAVVTSFTTGMAMAKLGAMTGYSSGKVTSVNYYDSSTRTSDLIVTNITAEHGDSGGLVFRNRIELDGGYAVAGILKGSKYTDTGSMFFSRADLINKKFGLTRY